MRAWINHLTCRQAAHRWLLFTSVSRSHTYPPCWAAGWDWGDEPVQSHNAIFLSLVLFFSRLQGWLGVKIHLTVSLKKELFFLFDLHSTLDLVSVHWLSGRTACCRPQKCTSPPPAGNWRRCERKSQLCRYCKQIWDKIWISHTVFSQLKWSLVITEETILSASVFFVVDLVQWHKCVITRRLGVCDSLWLMCLVSCNIFIAATRACTPSGGVWQSQLLCHQQSWLQSFLTQKKWVIEVFFLLKVLPWVCCHR